MSKVTPHSQSTHGEPELSPQGSLSLYGLSSHASLPSYVRRVVEASFSKGPYEMNKRIPCVHMEKLPSSSLPTICRTYTPRNGARKMHTAPSSHPTQIAAPWPRTDTMRCGALKHATGVSAAPAPARCRSFVTW